MSTAILLGLMIGLRQAMDPGVRLLLVPLGTDWLLDCTPQASGAGTL